MEAGVGIQNKFKQFDAGENNKENRNIRRLKFSK